MTDFFNGGRWKLIAEVIEVESGGKDGRPELAEALRLCRLHNATLVIAKLDRLSRDAHFLLGLQKSGARFVAADMPEGLAVKMVRAQAPVVYLGEVARQSGWRPASAKLPT